MLKFFQVRLACKSRLFSSENPHLAIAAAHHNIPIGLGTTAPDGNGWESYSLNTLSVLPDFDASVLAGRDDFARDGENGEGVDEVCVGMKFEEFVSF